MKDFIINLYKDDKKLVIFLSLFMILQPFLDARVFFENENLQIFGFTIPTIVRCVGIFVLCILSLRHVKKDKDHLFYCFYFFLLGVYIVIHHFVGKNSLNIPPSYTYSLFTEIFYFIRMIFPFVIMYCAKYSKLSYQGFIKIIIYSSTIFGAIIVISNILHISLPSYVIEYDHNIFNIFEWFTVGTDAHYFEVYTSKGWFFMANQIGGIMVLLLPLNYYDFIRNPRFINFISSLLLSVSMLMLGTRVSCYGMIAITLIMCIMGFFFGYIMKHVEKRNILIFCIFSIMISALFSIAPIHKRIYGYGEVDNLEISLTDVEEYYESENSKEMFVLQNYDERKIQKAYIYKLYPVKYDVDFWYDFISNNTGYVVENRELQRVITERIAELNPGLEYSLFGYTFSRFRNGYMYIENDFIVHYFTIGILGILLLLCPWIVIMLKGCYHVSKNKFNKMDFLSCTILFSMAICISASTMSGHIMDELIVTLYLGLVGGYFLKYIKEETEDA